jgi:CxxC-x17-CxxC domain-containing protein
MNFTDRFLKCSDCGEDFVFTAGEQLFFFDKQFKNDPKRCKLCKAKRAGLGRTTGPNGAIALPLSRTETKTQCSSCGVETTVPFKPTQGRPVLCRSCFQMKRVPTAISATLDSPSEKAEIQAQVIEEAIASQAADKSKLSMSGAMPLSRLFAPSAAVDSEMESALAGAGLNLC